MDKTNTQYFHIVTYSSHHKIGDQNQSLSLAKGLMQNISSINKTQKNFQDTTTLTKYLSTATNDQNNVVFLIIVGVEGIEFLKNSTDYRKFTTIYLSHQFSPELVTELPKIDFCVLPEHILTPAIIEKIKNAGCSLISIQGVLHNITEEKIITEYTNHLDTLPTLTDNGLLIILGGDAPTPQGNILHFSKHDVERIAEFINTKKVTALATNGPRTGAFDINNNKISYEPNKIDYISQHFLDLLKGKKILFYPYNRIGGDLYYALLGMILKNHGTILVPGESISKISEITSLFSESQIIVYINDAMNETHYAFLKSQLKYGKIKILHKNGQIETNSIKSDNLTLSNPQDIARKILASR